MTEYARCFKTTLGNKYGHPPLLCILCLALLFSLICTGTWAAVGKTDAPKVSEFPIYPVIKPNVDFWIQIFTKTSKNQGLLHDTQNLSIIYETISLDGSRTRKAGKKNRAIKKKAIQKYKAILLSLAKGKKPATKNEKRVAVLFGPSPKASAFKKAAYNIRVQTGLKEEFKSGLIRSGAYIDEFIKIFTSHGLPTDLVYLPCVESSYRYYAYSKFGAAGIWQFTRSTGRLYMDIGYVVDERRDPFISTDAAARLLKRNFGELKEWPLAITAYNHGLNGMRRAKKTKGSYEAIFKSYRSRSFKFASKNFYSEFLAARHVAKNHEKYFGPLAFDKPRSVHILKTKGFLSTNDIKTRLKVSESDIRDLNPALRKPVFKGQKYIPKGFMLKLPDSIGKKEAIEKLSTAWQARQKPSRFHRVQKGDTAGAVARLHSVSLNDLILANGLNRRATIYVGQNLRIPVKGQTVAMKKKSAPQKVVQVKKATQPPKPKTLAVKKKEPAPPLKATPPQTIAETPAIEQDLKSPINPTIDTSNLKVVMKDMKSGKSIGIITVQAEETLGHFADWLGVKTHTIRRLNRFKYGIPITIDQTVKLPIRTDDIQGFEEKRFEYHMEMEEDFFESFTIQGTRLYEVKKGDNIWNLCLNELEVPFWLLKKYNPKTKFSTLIPRQKIQYPLIEKREIE